MISECQEVKYSYLLPLFSLGVKSSLRLGARKSGDGTYLSLGAAVLTRQGGLITETIVIRKRVVNA
jgi:hypothetical protein